MVKPDYRITTRPRADPAAVVQGDLFRITVLTSGLLRLEYSPDGVFEDRASAFALFRDLPVPWFRLIETDHHLDFLREIDTGFAWATCLKLLTSSSPASKRHHITKAPINMKCM